ncbi:MAG: ABC transporter permease [Gammaproteobacteria bacterium]|nr:ABC transporter permease [Gammaproteobacteria bacterium]
MVRATLIIAHLTFMEARRRRIVLAALLGGLAFLLVYAAAVVAIERSLTAGPIDEVMHRVQLQFLTLAGLYVANFLTVAAAILLPVDTLSGEIDSGVMQTLASKPVRRSEILLGKWLTYWLMSGAYLVLLAGGCVLVMRFAAGFEQQNLQRALPLMLLGATVVLTVSLAGGVRLKTITNGMAAFAFYGLAFIGGWVEQIGAIVRNDGAQRIGTAISLLSPPDAMWRRAAYELQPQSLRDLGPVQPFSVASVPSTAMTVWTIGFVLVVLAFALVQFRRRPL